MVLRAKTGKGCSMPDGAFLRRDGPSVKDFFAPVEALRAFGDARHAQCGTGAPGDLRRKKIKSPRVVVKALRKTRVLRSCGQCPSAGTFFPHLILPLAHASASSPLPCGRGKVVDCGLLVYLNSSKAACGCPRPGSGARDTGRRSRLPGKGEKDARCCFGEGKGT